MLWTLITYSACTSHQSATFADLVGLGGKADKESTRGLETMRIIFVLWCLATGMLDSRLSIFIKP